ncbi:periplasmic heavy metal sensor [Oceaniglobus trochenteri]|uniref:periplasmic heavy metal sensor n=1 Tax=Oceaniglobus trochenteri TaxID=2763260 RepID=UPI001D001157|nr:periplasmic heavy metal sensor [Oceaniglobus trochenteri]
MMKTGLGKSGRILLVLSLAANLLVVGVVVGAKLSDRGGHDDRRGPEQALREIGNVPFVMALPRDDRSALIKELGGTRSKAFRANRERLRERFEAVLALLRADDFDAEALRALMAEQRETLFERQKLGEDLLIARLSGMSAKDRAAYADRLDRSLRRGPRKGAHP